MDLLVTILLYMLIVICLLAVAFGSYKLSQIVMDIIDYGDWPVADDNICDMLEIILSDLDKYKSCISYNSYLLYIRIDVEEGYYKHIILDYADKLTMTTPAGLKFPKSREKTLKKLITRAINEIEASDNNKKLTKVRSYLSSALNPTTNQHKTPEVLDIDE
ncbi:hypothetical protein [Snodgrassella sp. ESL0324]|uniref:hypothetical protein n=1 Tax=Snodgrassella sp. ESL0324 TaxID=2705033 RepID=UPI001583E792|nr:hypothetical protein [Snodgrassella sp. ESL0324]NUF08946.1 hypothetical protein [Snodgrassella sp. ESL0324]